MNQGIGSPGRSALDLEPFRRELNLQRRFRLEQLGTLFNEANLPCPAAQAEVRAVLAAGAQQALAEIEAALARLSRGRFGNCELCGNSISVHQLEAIPTTRFCLRCDHRRQAKFNSGNEFSVRG
ncbi:TraR/DksA C4-type zinc finger protein [Kribbella sp. NPDC003557]|uniref:TraR/DksA C4-type zinc finger protein n=1 Tax=Kribbella sp. NPDC003557 TaxID=3154449 RepID=UPI0033B50622